MEKNIFIYKGFDYSFMDDAGKAIMAARIKKEAREAEEEAKKEPISKELREIWKRINNHGDFTFWDKEGTLERHKRNIANQYKKSKLASQPSRNDIIKLLQENYPVTRFDLPNKNLVIISEIDED